VGKIRKTAPKPKPAKVKIGKPSKPASTLPPGGVQEYWETRHRQKAGSLQAAGRIKLSEADNRRDYAVKREQIAEVLPSGGGTLLVAGCGTGELIGLYLDKGFQVVALDFIVEAVEAARRRYGRQIVAHVADITDWQTEVKFDVVVCIDVLLHVVDDKKWREFLRLTAQERLKPGGVLVVLDHLVGRPAASQSYVRLRTQDQYKEAAAAVGLNLLQHKRFNLPSEGVHKNLLVFEQVSD